MTAAAPDPGRRRFGWLKVALVASLALNLLVAGAVVAHRFAPAGVERGHGMRFGLLLPRSFFRELDRDRRAALFEQFKPRREELGAARAELRDGTLAIAAALEAEPYDPARLDGAVDTVVRSSQAIAERAAVATRDLVAALTPAERKALAAHLRARAEHRHGRR